MKDYLQIGNTLKTKSLNNLSSQTFKLFKNIEGALHDQAYIKYMTIDDKMILDIKI